LSEASRDKVVITVSDNGRGIPDEIREKIFNPFFTTKEVGKGTGLGLALVQKIIEKMNGDIQVESKLGSGTTFKISIPSVMIHQSLLGIDEFK
jgi:signal transduction histidine kinase